MADEFTYPKKRKEFGRHGQFEDTDTKIVGSVQPDQSQNDQYVRRDPNRIILSNIERLSQHGVNSDIIPTGNKGMKHTEGGWPSEIDPTEPDQQAKYFKKMYKDTTLGFGAATKSMSQDSIRCIMQNNQIDLFQEYFAGEQAENLAEAITTKTQMITKDPNKIKRAATQVKWHPETSELRVAASYASLRFQQMPHDICKDSYIWNLNNPNFPETTLQPQSPLCSLAFNHKNSDIIVGGCYNGSLAYFDVRKGNSAGVVKPFRTTLLEKSHHDPVYDVYWLTVGKTGNECVSASTDGKLLWWDMKSEKPVPSDCLELNTEITVDDETKTKLLGATSLEYNSDAGPLKYLIGTEQGYIFQANKRKVIEISTRFGCDAGGKHFGPVYSLWRNPMQTKYFLSIGDWSAKIWSDELKQPIMQTRYHSAYLTDGCWSPQRCGLFYLTRIDGFMEIWDFYYKQNEIAYTVKVSDFPLTSITLNQNMAAVGDAEGTISIMSLCKPLYETTNKEKEVMQTIFEREFRREKNLEIQKKFEKEAKAPAKKAVDPEKAQKDREEKMKTMLEEQRELFFKTVSEGEDMEAIRARGEAFDQQPDETKQMSSSIKIERVNLEAGKNYTLVIDGQPNPFTAEEGGIISGSKINGQVQDGQLFFKCGDKEYEGSFVSGMNAELQWKDPSGNTGQSTAKLQ